MRYAYAAMALAISSSAAFADTPQNSCLVKTCAPGDHAVTYATKQEPFLACPTRELAAYTSSVLGLLALQVQLTGAMPNISDKTGEPEYLDQNGKPNETRLMLDSLRNKAGVTSFDQAVATCAPGRNKSKVTILNVQKDAEVVYVHDEARKINYWMPTSSLDKR